MEELKVRKNRERNLDRIKLWKKNSGDGGDGDGGDGDGDGDGGGDGDCSFPPTLTHTLILTRWAERERPVMQRM